MEKSKNRQYVIVMDTSRTAPYFVLVWLGIKYIVLYYISALNPYTKMYCRFLYTD